MKDIHVKHGNEIQVSDRDCDVKLFRALVLFNCKLRVA